MMLEQLDIRPRHRVLEIGAGTGYNSTLLRELVGEHGQVTTIDIDPDAVAHTRASHERAGVTDVYITEGDGEEGVADRAPYDRIIVTAGAWNLPQAWLNQLADGGILLVPLRFRGTTRSVAFRREGDRLGSISVKLCGFIPMRNDDGEQDIDLGGGVMLRCDDDQEVIPEAIASVLDTQQHHEWSEVTVGAEPLHGLWGRLAVYEPGTCRIAAQPRAVLSGRATPVIPMLSPAVVDGSTLAYLAHRPAPAVNGKKRSELGVIGHGPDAEKLCNRVIEHVRYWDSDRYDRLALAASTAEPEASDPSTRLIPKHHLQISIRWEE